MLTEVGQNELARVPQMEPVRRALLEKALKFYQGFLDEDSADPALRLETARAWARVAIIHGQLGQLDQTEKDLREAVALLEKLAAEFPSVPDYRTELAASYYSLGHLLTFSLGRHAEAQSAVRLSLALSERLAAEYPGVPDYRLKAAAAQELLGATFENTGQPQKAAEAYRKALAGLEKLVAEFPASAAYRGQKAGTHRALGAVLHNEPVEAEKHLREALKLMRELPGSPLDQVLGSLGNLLRDTGRPREAEEAYRKALALAEKPVADFPATPWYRGHHAHIYLQYGRLLAATNRPQEAEEAYRQVLVSQERVVREAPTWQFSRGLLLQAQNELVALLKSAGRCQEAEQVYRQAVTLYEKVTADHPVVAEYQQGLATAYKNLGAFLRDEARRQDGENAYGAVVAAYEKAATVLAKLAADHPTVPQYQADLATVHFERSDLLQRAGRPGEAESTFLQGMAIQEKLVARFPDAPEYRERWAARLTERGDLLKAIGQPALAGESYRQAIALQEKLVAVHPAVLAYRLQLAESYNRLTDLLWQANRVMEWEAPARRAVAVLEDLPAGSTPDPYFRATKGQALRVLAYRLWTLKKLAEAEKFLRDAAAVFEQLPAETPGQSKYLEYEADTRLELGRLLRDIRPQAAKDEVNRAVAAWTKAIDLEPRHRSAWGQRGTAHAELGHWDKAAADFARAVELDADNVMLRYWLALARLGAGDWAGYRSSCAALFDHFGQTDKHGVAHWVAWTAGLAPDAVKELGRPVKLAESALRSAPTNHSYGTTTGAALYRAGRFAEAVVRLNEAGAARPTLSSLAYTWFFLAMTHERLGHAGEAGQWLAKAIKCMEQETRDNNPAWNRRLTLQLLRREAEALIKPAGAQPPTPADH
jgi:tetratricopeptide (TPR) repeat protein